MKLGSYRDRVDFDAFEVSKFTPHIFCYHMDMTYGCGASALSLLTGIHPSKFKAPPRGDWKDHIVLSILNANKFKTARLTMRGVTNFDWTSYPIGRQHVVLAKIKLIKYNASWVVIHSGIIFHNFELAPLKPLEFINHPVMAAYLVKGRQWESTKKHLTLS